MAAGDASNEREGRVVKHMMIQTHLNYIKDQTIPSVSVRKIHFIWKQALTVPTVTDILDIANGFSPYNQNQAGNYKILRDTITNLDSDVVLPATPTFAGRNRLEQANIRYTATQTYTSTGLGTVANWVHGVLLIASNPGCLAFFNGSALYVDV